MIKNVVFAALAVGVWLLTIGCRGQDDILLRDLRQYKAEKVMIAYHEAGHGIMALIFQLAPAFKDKNGPTYIFESATLLPMFVEGGIAEGNVRYGTTPDCKSARMKNIVVNIAGAMSCVSFGLPKEGYEKDYSDAEKLLDVNKGDIPAIENSLKEIFDDPKIRKMTQKLAGELLKEEIVTMPEAIILLLGQIEGSDAAAKTIKSKFNLE